MKLSINASAWALPQLSTFVVWALVAASACFWFLRWTDPLSNPNPVAQAEPEPAVDRAATAQWLGAGAGVKATSPLAGRFKVMGVVADRQGVGAALIGMDGKSARPYRVGAEVEPGLWVQKLLPRSVQLGVSLTGPSLLDLELPEVKKPAEAPRKTPL
jgi:general secretion pathway protein C